MDNQSNPSRDRELWKTAKARAGFKAHAVTYLLVNAMLWGIWALTSPNSEMWPIWPTLGWGIGLFFNYLGAYGFMGQRSLFSAEAEYEKLARRQG